LRTFDSASSPPTRQATPLRRVSGIPAGRRDGFGLAEIQTSPLRFERKVESVRIDDIEYAQSGEVNIAWQRYGSRKGVPVVAVPPLATCMEVVWESQPARHFFERWGAFGDVVQFDKRGCGASDRIEGAPGVEERMDDIRAVMDAAGLERAALYGLSEGGPMAMLFAATYPERVSALVLHGTFACARWHPDYDSGVLDEVASVAGDLFADTWATPDTVILPLFIPSQVGNEEVLRWLLRFQRAAATPKAIRQLMELNIDIDVRHVVGSIRCPTLVLHAAGDLVINVSHGQWLAEHIEGSRFVTYDSADHYPMFDAVDDHIDVIEEFLTGELGTAPVDRVLATVLFTDIVDSTGRAEELGDTAWRALLDRHDEAVHREVTRHGGRVVHGTGDGLLATFDSPSRAIRCAHDAIAAVRPLGLEVRAGVHTGEIERRGGDIAGIAVHIGARVAGLAGAGEVLASPSVPPLVVGSEITFDDRGDHQLKGVAGDWRIVSASLT
jgi:class 3 adenylate cyclase